MNNHPRPGDEIHSADRRRPPEHMTCPMTTMEDVATVKILKRKPDDEEPARSQPETLSVQLRQARERSCPDTYCEIGGDHPSCKFELKECFPCLFNPLGYFIEDRLPFIRWLGLLECCSWLPNFISWLAKKAPRMPAFDCQQVYNPKTAVSDAVAGLTVGLMVVPQAMAYAKIAELPIEVYYLTHNLHVHVRV